MKRPYEEKPSAWWPTWKDRKWDGTFTAPRPDGKWYRIVAADPEKPKGEWNVFLGPSADGPWALNRTLPRPHLAREWPHHHWAAIRRD